MIKKVGLITPYQGYNLGDAAIQDTMVRKLMAIDSSIECVGITLYPADTRNRHGIEALPVTGLEVKDYSATDLLLSGELLPSSDDGLILLGTGADDESGGTNPTIWVSILETARKIKNIPVIGNLLRFIVFRLREAWSIVVEIREFIAACRHAGKLDLIVVSGGGQLDEGHGGCWGHPYSIFRWALIARLLRKPFAIASVGSAMIDSALSRKFINFALKTATYRSYRDIGTREQLQDLPLIRNDPIVRDLALAINPEKYLAAKSKNDHRMTVAISPIYHVAKNYSSYNQFLSSTADFIKWLLDQDYRILIYRTTSVERLVIADIQQTLAGRYPGVSPDQIEIANTPGFEDVLDNVASADLVVASRLHSVILSHVLLKPTIAISWDRKVSAHMQDMGQTDYLIDIHEVTLGALKNRFIALKSDSEEISHTLGERIASFQDDLDTQFQRLVDLANGSASNYRDSGTSDRLQRIGRDE